MLRPALRAATARLANVALVASSGCSKGGSPVSSASRNTTNNTTSTTVLDSKKTSQTHGEAGQALTARTTIKARADEPPYAEIVRTSLQDIEAYWTEQFPATYGKKYEPLTGGIFPVTQQSQGVPQCGNLPATYASVQGMRSIARPAISWPSTTSNCSRSCSTASGPSTWPWCWPMNGATPSRPAPASTVQRC